MTYKGDQGTEIIILTFKSFLLIVKFAGESCPVPLSYTLLFHKRGQDQLRLQYGVEDEGDFLLGTDLTLILTKENKVMSLQIPQDECIHTDIGIIGYKHIRNGDQEQFLLM